MRERTVRELAELEHRQQLQKLKEEHHEEVVRTTAEDIDDFENKLGLRNLRPRQRWADVQRGREEEAKQMGVRLVKPSRCSSPLKFYDYDTISTGAIPVSPRRATTAAASLSVQRSGMRRLQTEDGGALAGNNTMTSGRGRLMTMLPATTTTATATVGGGGAASRDNNNNVDHGFDPPSHLLGFRNNNNNAARATGGGGGNNNSSSSHIARGSPTFARNSNANNGDSPSSRNKMVGMMMMSNNSNYNSRNSHHVYDDDYNNSSGNEDDRGYSSYREVRIVTKKAVEDAERQHKAMLREQMKQEDMQRRQFIASAGWGASGRIQLAIIQDMERQKSSRQHQSGGHNYHHHASSSNSGRPMTEWTARTMIEPIFLPETVPNPHERTTVLPEKRPPFLTSTGTSLGWDSVNRVLTLSSPLTSAHAPSVGMRRPASCWEETVGRKYYEKRMREFEIASKKFEMNQADAAVNQARVYAHMRQVALGKMRAEREARARAAMERGEYFPVVSKATVEEEMLREAEQAAAEEEAAMRMGMTLEERQQEALEFCMDVKHFEDKMAKVVTPAPKRRQQNQF